MAPFVGDLQKGIELHIENGPSDWDLWLNFRGTVSEVSFTTQEQFCVPPFPDARQFIDGNIYLLETQPRNPKFDWKIKGLGHKGSTWFYFEGVYDPRGRKGSLTITDVIGRR